MGLSGIQSVRPVSVMGKATLQRDKRHQPERAEERYMYSDTKTIARKTSPSCGNRQCQMKCSLGWGKYVLYVIHSGGVFFNTHRTYYVF